MSLNDVRTKALMAVTGTSGSLSDLEMRFWTQVAESGVGVNVPSDQFFVDLTSLEAFFIANPDRLKEGAQAVVEGVSGAQLYEYKGGVWKDVTSVVRGPSGDTIIGNTFDVVVGGEVYGDNLESIEFLDTTAELVGGTLKLTPVGVGLPTGSALRATYRTPTTHSIKQTLAANNIPQVLSFNINDMLSSHALCNMAGNYFEFTSVNTNLFTLSAQIMREEGGGGDAYWTGFVETSDDNGATWTPLAGSSRRITLTSSDTDNIRHVSFSSAIKGVVGRRFRFLHVTNRSDKVVSVVASAATGGAPSSDGLSLSMFTI